MEKTNTFPYNHGSGWSDITELQCLLILKKLIDSNFNRGMHSRLCKELATEINNRPPFSSLNAKVGNYKSVAGYNESSKNSRNTKILYEAYKNYSVKKLELVISKMKAKVKK